MSPKRTVSTAFRVFTQLKNDHRTMALIFFMPTVLITVLYFVFEGNRTVFQNIAPLLLGIIPFTLMFIVTSVAVLRERTSGTLERLLTSPATKLDIIFGYATAFASLAFIQALIASIVTLRLLDVLISGPRLALLLIAVLAGLAGMSFGLLFSAFAKNEFQAVQFMPAFVLPQFLTCGLFIPRDQMATFIEYFSDVMPVTYIVEALQGIKITTGWTHDLIVNILILCGFIIFALALGATSIRSK